jgi:hypothetical protein
LRAIRFLNSLYRRAGPDHGRLRGDAGGGGDHDQDPYGSGGDHGPADAGEHAPRSGEGTGLFDHDHLDIDSEVAVASPWDPAPDGDDEQGDQESASHEDDPPSPWTHDSALPPPDANDREDGVAPEHMPENGDQPQPHPYDEAREQDPYAHYDQFRDLWSDER